MSCNSCEMRKKYPETITAIFMSATGDTVQDTPAGIRAEIAALGATSSKPIERSLRPVTDLRNLKSSQKLFLNKITFYGYDPLTLTGSSPQNSTVVADIYASRTTNKAYAQSQFQNGLLPINWIDNYCNPTFKVDGRNYLPGLNTAEEGEVNKNKAIGIELPHCFTIEKELDSNSISSIDIVAALAQFNSTSGVYQNYIVKCVAEFWVGNGYFN